MVKYHFHPSFSPKELKTLVTANVIKSVEKYIGKV